MRTCLLEALQLCEPAGRHFGSIRNVNISSNKVVKATLRIFPTSCVEVFFRDTGALGSGENGHEQHVGDVVMREKGLPFWHFP